MPNQVTNDESHAQVREQSSVSDCCGAKVIREGFVQYCQNCGYDCEMVEPKEQE
jgi:hypothetical protein